MIFQTILSMVGKLTQHHQRHTPDKIKHKIRQQPGSNSYSFLHNVISSPANSPLIAYSGVKNNKYLSLYKTLKTSSNMSSPDFSELSFLSPGKKQVSIPNLDYRFNWNYLYNFSWNWGSLYFKKNLSFFN